MRGKTEINQIEIQIPQEFVNFVNEKLENNGKAGRPNFFQQLEKENYDLIQEILNIVERVWLKPESIGKIAKSYKTSYHTIWRLLQDLEPFKEKLTEYITLVPCRKTFFNPKLETSDYETVRAYIKRAKRNKLKTWKENIKIAMKCWKFLRYRDPAKWTPQQVVDYLDTLPQGSQSRHLDCIRQFAPQIKDEVRTGQYREKLRRRKKTFSEKK